ncbi:unnamed protein product [Prunus armeniaca]
MSRSGSSEARTPIFSGENYEFWRIKMVTIFKSYGLGTMLHGHSSELKCRRVRHSDTRTLRGYASDMPWTRVNALDTVKRLSTWQTHGQDTAGNF